MRNFQKGLFGLGVLSYIAAILFIGQQMGDTLWRAGVAIMLTDIVCTRLWPAMKT